MSTALVLTAARGHDGRESHDPRETRDVRGANRPRADFIAQLIAAAIAAPQTRPRRRAEPEQAIAAYTARDERPTPKGREVSREL